MARPRIDRTPIQVQGLPTAPTHLSAGAVHACALVAGGQAYCWGQNLQGQIGDGTKQNRASAVPVRGGLSFTEIHAGGAQTCSSTEDGTQYCWGLNRSGQLGDGTRVSRSTPTRVGQ
jgi:alpha-tubulin suppressor-like RCC1 family protein